MNKLVLVFLLYSLLQYTLLFAQPGFQLSGHVTDASSGEPLHLVNVFIAGTTWGDATDKDGQYIIRNIPPGTYKLIVSMIGYKIQQKIIELSGTKNNIANFSLEPKILEGEEVVVTAEDAKEWRKNLKIFERVFFGIKEFAKECKLLNPEVLDFEYDRKLGRFQAFAEQPLRFVNNALGYEITFLMNAFAAKLYNDNIYSVEVILGRAELKKGHRQWDGTVKFKELVPVSNDQQKKWQKNRLIAYNGSERHFLKALCANRVKEEGFGIWGIKHFGTMRKYDYGIKAKDLLRPGSKPKQCIFSFPDLIKIWYKNEPDEIKFKTITLLMEHIAYPDLESFERAQARLRMQSTYQESLIKIAKGHTLTITSDGVIVSGSEFRSTYGYWSWNGPDEWLPADYEPPEDRRLN